MHHANAWEANSASIVVDTLARDTADFAASDMAHVTNLESFDGPENATTLRRLVMRGSAVQCREYDTRDVAGLEGRALDFPNHLPPKCTGQPHSAVFAVVCCCIAVCAVIAFTHMRVRTTAHTVHILLARISTPLEEDVPSSCDVFGSI